MRPITTVRVAATMAAVILGGSIQAAPAAAMADRESVPSVTVREEHGIYSVVARFQVAQPPALVLAVLTDYENIPRFMPQIEKSVVLERTADRTIVQQLGISRLMALSKRVHLVLEISESSDALHFRDRCRYSFTRYEGSWRIFQRSGTTEIVYELTAQPSFSVPAFLAKRALRRESNEMIGQLQREISARSASH